MTAKTCFVIAPIGEEGSDVRKRSDQILKYIICPVAEPLGYSVVRADKIDKPGLITSQVIQHVIDADLVIADLTGRNPNVFYELAIRHAIRKPYVQLIQLGETLPFDVSGVRSIAFDIRDLDSVESCKTQIQNSIEAMDAGAQIDSPVTTAVQIQTLRTSSDPVDHKLAQLSEAVSQLSEKIDQGLSRLYPSFQLPSYNLGVQGPYGTNVSAGIAQWTPFSDLGTNRVQTPGPNVDAELYVKAIEVARAALRGSDSAPSGTKQESGGENPEAQDG